MSLDALVATVKEKIGGIIQKPKMQEKLLQKPPFRFLHDTISAVSAQTGFGEGLYTPDELDSTKVTEKQQKIVYLEKIINLVGICQGRVIDVRAAKIVAGLEAENTNIFLAALADAALDPTVDRAAAVRRVLAGEVAGAGPAAAKSGVLSPRGAKGSKPETKPDSKAEAKAAPAKKDSKAVEAEKAVDIVDVKRAEDDPVLAERGRSRGGTRSGARVGDKSASDGVGLAGMSSRPPGLDAQIEKCDGNWETTASLLGAIIQKPKLTEKLLSKPPFRFLHDVFSEVTRATGFARDLYGADEADSAAVTEKTQKIAYLEKMTKLVGMQLNTIIEAKPAKIVAGLEPEKTNIFLQLLALAASTMPDSTAAVRSIVSGDVGAPQDAPSAPAASAGDDAKQAPGRVKRDDQAKSPRQDEKPKAAAKQAEDDMLQAAAKSEADDRREEDAPKDSGDGEGGEDGESKRSLRPTTARRRPPKIKETAKEVTTKESAAVAKKAEGIMIDGQNDEEDEDGVPEEKRLADIANAQAKAIGGSLSSDGAEPQSKLVKDIMSRQAEQEAAARAANQEEEKQEEKGSGSGIRLSRRKPTAEKRGSTGNASAVISTGSGDIEKLRKAVQVLVQHTGPLGSCMDYIQEDISIMKGELDRWESECKKYEQEIENENAKTTKILKPLTMELSDLEKQVEDIMVKISSSKASISRNQERIQQSLRLIATA